MTATSETDVPAWRFAEFSPGQSLTTVEVTLGPEHLQGWRSIFGVEPDPERLPRGLVVSALVEGFIKCVQPRPKGNIHASQMLEFTQCVPRLGDIVKVKATVGDTETRRGRNWVTFSLTATANGALLCTGDFAVIWATCPSRGTEHD